MVQKDHQEPLMNRDPICWDGREQNKEKGVRARTKRRKGRGKSAGGTTDCQASFVPSFLFFRRDPFLCDHRKRPELEWHAIRHWIKHSPESGWASTSEQLVLPQ